MTDIPALQEQERLIRSRLEELADLNRRLEGESSPRLRKLVELSTHSLHVVEGILFYLALEMRMAVAQDGAIEQALQESLGEDPLDIADIIARESRQLVVPSIDLDAVDLDREVVVIVPREVAVTHQLIAFGWMSQAGKTYLMVAMADPTNIFAREDVRFLIGHHLKIYVASEEQIERAIAKYYPRPDPERA